MTKDMASPIITIETPNDQPADIRVKPFTFADTEVTIESVSDKGRELFASMFGAGAVSATVRKSYLFDLEKFANAKGVIVG